VVTQSDYNRETVEAARSVLLEIVRVLSEYRDNIVLIGGWVPLFLCTSPEEPHVGSMDIDLALDHRELTEAGYRTIQQLLVERGYEQGPQPFIFYRQVAVGGRQVRVEVDLLGGEYGGTGRGHRTQKVQDIRVRKARGADLAFDSPVETTIEGTLPSGVKDTVKLRVASLVPFIVMKSIALDERLKEKDSWDIYYCIRNYPAGAGGVATAFAPHIDHGLVKEGLTLLAKYFDSVDGVGPSHVADFAEVSDAEERARIRRDAFEQVRYVLDQLGIT
jgi:hypothetical protein